MWDKILTTYTDDNGLWAAKMLRKIARVSTVFAQHAAVHPDNNVPA